MARKRIIDPEFWSDEEIGQWSFAARLFYIGLWNFADDKGRFKAANALLKAQIFPYDVKIHIDNLKKELNHKIQWYEIEKLQYGFVRNFLKYQRIDRPTESKLPAPPPFDELSSKPREQLAPNIIEVKLSKDKASQPEICGLTQKIGGLIFKDSFLASLRTTYSMLNVDSEILACITWYKNKNTKIRSWDRAISNWFKMAYERVGVVESKPVRRENILIKSDPFLKFDPVQHKKVSELIHATAEKMQKVMGAK